MNSLNIQWEDGREISRSQISEFENELGIELPSDFKEVIKNQDGGTPELPALDFCGMSEKVFSGLIPLLESNDYSESIIDTIESYEERFPEGIIPFGQDPFGNLYCFDYRNKTTPILVYWDHEEEMDNENQFCVVASNFTELLNMLYLQEDE